MKKIVVIGGGASGLFASYSASQNINNKVILLEKNEKLGKKIYITGKGKCNFTNAISPKEFLNFVVTNPKFLFSSIFNFSSDDVMSFFDNNGMPYIIERGNRVFPKSYKASDVTKTLEKVLIKNGVEIKLNTKVVSIIVKEGAIKGIKTEKEEIDCDSVIICTGGCSYQLTGSTGDGYYFAKKLGHTIITPKSALCGLELDGNDYLPIQGLTLKNIAIKAIINNKETYSDFGELIFTHFGVSGPIILSCSSIINKYNLNNSILEIDLKPALDFDTLDKRLQREFQTNNLKEIGSVMKNLIPQSLVEIFLSKAKIPYSKKCSNITKEERKSIVNLLKHLTFSIKGLRDIDEAIITSGGVSVKEINPNTMESKIVKGLFFAGEVIDVDAFTGGFNLQIAFSTGYLAGLNA